MKTVDLIPFLLLELNERDKYGFELIKDIESKSEGKLVIKQPTLYTILKKLEKSKFISSYWQDSEIGGKRHYYKLTEFGKIQISTLPSYEELLNQALEEDDINSGEELNLLNTAQAEPKETILPSNEVFNDENIDVKTKTEINKENIEILKTESIIEEENFATNKNVSKFTEKTANISSNIEPNYSTDLLPEINSYNSSFAIDKTSIKYVDYKNIKKDEKYIYAKNVSKNLLLKTLSTFGIIIFMLCLSSFITVFTGTSALYYIFWISSLVFAIFYPLIYALNLDKIKLKYIDTDFKLNIKRRFYLTLSLVLTTFIVCLIVNISIGNNTFIKIFSFNNFENLYSPILLSSSAMFDTLFSYLLLKKLSK